MPANELREELRVNASGEERSAQSNPYVGPRAFKEDEILYGRGREVRELLARVRSDRIVLLHSPSGAGKTSLLQSALLPELREDGYHVLPIVRVGLAEADGGWDVSNRYLQSTLTALAPDLPSGVLNSAPKHQLLAQTLDAVRASRLTGWNEMQVLVFDQFEELLSLDPSDISAKREFIGELAVALQEQRLAAIFSMREEWIGELEPLTTQVPTRLNRRFRLDYLSRSGALEAIHCPAERAGVRFDEESAERIVDALQMVTVVDPTGHLKEARGTHVEPLQLQLVCYGLWQRQSHAWSAGSADRVIRSDGISLSGEVDIALSDYYTARVAEAADRAGIDEKAIRRWIGNRLITPGGLRNQVLWEGPTVAELPYPAVEQLEKMLIIRREVRGGRTWFELVHDRFVGPIQRANQEWFESNDLLGVAARAWASDGRPRSLLMDESKLRRLVPMGDSELNELEREFVAASLAKIRRHRGIIRILLGVGVVALMMTWSISAWYAQRTVNLEHYRWLGHQVLESQRELQARTYDEIPRPAPLVSEIEWSDRRHAIPTVADSESFGPIERAADSARALALLAATLSEIGDVDFDIPLHISEAVLGSRAQATASQLGLTVVSDVEPGVTRGPNSIVFAEGVPLPVIRALALSLVVDGSRLARIRRVDTDENTPAVDASFYLQAYPWPPLTSEQIVEMTSGSD